VALLVEARLLGFFVDFLVLRFLVAFFAAPLDALFLVDFRARAFAAVPRLRGAFFGVP